MRLIGTLFIFSVSISFTQAQYRDYGRAMVTYSDGSFFIGEILEQNPLIWDFKLSTGDTIHLNSHYIKMVMSESDVFIYDRQKYHIRNGIFANSSLMFNGGWESSVQWDGTVGFGLTDRWDVGVGLGISGHDMDLGNDWVAHEFVNAFGYGRFFLNKRKWRLYLDSKMGYGFPLLNEWEGDHSGGFYFQPGVGIVFSSRHAFKWNIGVSQYLLNTKGNTTSFGNFGNPIEVDYNVWYNRTVFQFGLSMMITRRELRQFFLF